MAWHARLMASSTWWSWAGNGGCCVAGPLRGRSGVLGRLRSRGRRRRRCAGRRLGRCGPAHCCHRHRWLGVCCGTRRYLSTGNGLRGVAHTHNSLSTRAATKTDNSARRPNSLLRRTNRRPHRAGRPHPRKPLVRRGRAAKSRFARAGGGCERPGPGDGRWDDTHAARLTCAACIASCIFPHVGSRDRAYSISSTHPDTWTCAYTRKHTLVLLARHARQNASI